MKYRRVTLEGVIDGRAQDTDGNWVDMSNEDRYDYFELFREFLLGYCREGSENYRNINTLEYDQLENCGVYRRLEWTEQYGVEYVAGQDYRSEINTIKKLITK